MEASAGLVAGSHNRNELVVIRREPGGGGPGAAARLAAEAPCLICGDDVGVGFDGEPFVACNECAFPVCRACYEYERREGTQNCPQCKTRYKRRKGTPGLVHAFLSFLLLLFLLASLSSLVDRRLPCTIDDADLLRRRRPE